LASAERRRSALSNVAQRLALFAREHAIPTRQQIGVMPANNAIPRTFSDIHWDRGYLWATT
jgi:hypothetical protein